MSYSPSLPSNASNHSDASGKEYQEISSNEAIASIPRVGSMSSLSSACSFNTFGTNQRNEEEIFENVQSLSHELPLLTTAISPSPKRTSPTSSPSQRQNNNGNHQMHEPEPILSALDKSYTHNIAPSSSSEPNHNNNNNNVQHPQDINLSHQDLKYLTHSASDQTDFVPRAPSTHNNIIDGNASENSASRSSLNTIGSALLNGIRTVNSYITEADDRDGVELVEDEEKKEDCNLNENVQSLHNILSSPHFMENAIQMYGHLDNALTNINNLKSHQLEQIKSLRRRKQRKRRCIYANIDSNDDNDDDNAAHVEKDNESLQEIDVNERVVHTMKTLITSTTQMGSFFSSSSLFDKLSSSISYMSYISVSTITPFIYNLVESILLELYATIKDIIEYYDPDPKNNVLWRIIDKMNEIIDAIHGLLALSDCFYEICSENEEDEDDDEDDEDDDDDDFYPPASHPFFKEIKKEKQD